MLAVRRFSRLFCTSTQRLKKANLLEGEWRVDSYPNIKSILKNPQRMTESLVQRILVNSNVEADELVDELAIVYQEYQDCLETDTTLKEEWARDKGKLSGLERYEKQAEVKESRRTLQSIKERLLNMSTSLPNILSGAKIGGGQLSLILDTQMKQFNDRVKAPPLHSLGMFDDMTQAFTGLKYLTGQKALTELDLTYFTAEFLEYLKFTEITVPSFIRTELAPELGLGEQNLRDVYHLQTKLELHEDNEVSEFREVIKNRKDKIEDYYIFQAPGLSEVTLYSLLLRRQLPVSMLPLRFFSVGNRYRKPNTGRPVQSKVGMFISSSSTVSKAEEEYGYLADVISHFWKALDVPIIASIVEPHNLQLHEAAAVEFVMEVNNWNKSRATEKLITHGTFPVLSRLSLSYDYVSRRMMTYAKFSRPTNDYCHFVSAELIDIQDLLSCLESK